MKLSMVTVTYGSRENLAGVVIKSIYESGLCDEIILVSNGAEFSSQFQEFLTQSGVKTVSLPSNYGSARGFSAGISEFLKGDCDLLLVLDDDNLPSPGAIEKLLKVAIAQRERTGHCAVLGFRPDHQPWVSKGENVDQAYGQVTAFLNFTASLFIGRIVRRLTGPSPVALAKAAEYVVPYAPYGGLLINRELIEEIGLPNEEFYLYCDDTDFTSRITKLGVPINLIVGAEIKDISTSWSSEHKKTNSFQRLLNAGSDLQVFYATRNRVYFEKSRIKGGNRLKYGFNMILFFVILGVFAALTRKWTRMKLITHATAMGLKGQLGVEPTFVLV